MPMYRIHNLKGHLRDHFRFAPHVSGTASIKPRDYGPGSTVDAASPYAAFFALRDTAAPLQVGDLLEAEDGSLRIFKYVGFEEARWLVQESQAPLEAPEEVPQTVQP
jgi:hypothetical protein